MPSYRVDFNPRHGNLHFRFDDLNSLTRYYIARRKEVKRLTTGSVSGSGHRDGGRMCFPCQEARDDFRFKWVLVRGFPGDCHVAETRWFHVLYFAPKTLNFRHKEPESMKYLPSLSEALNWCSKAGVNTNWGAREMPSDNLAAHADSVHLNTEEIKSANKIVVHRSGFTSGNASLFRWYHRVVNGWRDVGYHLIIGNGRHGFSIAGAIEVGRPLKFVGAHCKGRNADSFAICLIDNDDHFRSIPPSDIELHSLENALLFLHDKVGVKGEIFGHSDFGNKTCPGQAVPVKEIAERVRKRKGLIRHRESAAKTLDLRHPFKKGVLNYADPDHAIGQVAERGFTRIAYPYQWLQEPWEDLKLAERWTQTAHRYDIDVLLYTGPFGTELSSFTEREPQRRNWLQRNKQGHKATYDSGGYLLMFCPSSPYLPEYRLPIIVDFLRETGCDGVFFDIPWIVRDACHCHACANENGSADIELLRPKEKSIRKSLAKAVVSLRSQFPNIWMAANVAAPCVWKTDEIGATPASLNGLFDELVVEWTPSRASEIELIRKSVISVRVDCPASRVSHAWAPERAGSLGESVCKLEEDEGIGRWLVESLQ